MEAELKRLETAGPARERAMSVIEQPESEDIKVHIRGSVHTLGEPVPRGFLQVATRARAAGLLQQRERPARAGRLADGARPTR